LVTRPGGHPDVDDFRIRVVLEPLALPWPVTFYFTEAVHEDGATVFICEGSEHGAAVRPGQEALDAEQSIRGILRWRRRRRTDSDRLRVRDAYRAYVAREGRRHGAYVELQTELFLNRKAIRRALVDCVRRGEMDGGELPPSRSR
jgi:hypothetical protein